MHTRITHASWLGRGLAAAALALAAVARPLAAQTTDEEWLERCRERGSYDNWYDGERTERACEVRVERLRPWRLGATMFSVFGTVALLLAAVGLYGVIAFNVAQRAHELGVRIALGAQTHDILRLVVGDGVRVTAVGIALGGAAALGVGRFVAPLLFHVSPRDPATLATVAIVLLGVAVAASGIPAWRASRVDPTAALRSD